MLSCQLINQILSSKIVLGTPGCTFLSTTRSILVFFSKTFFSGSLWVFHSFHPNSEIQNLELKTSSTFFGCKKSTWLLSFAFARIRLVTLPCNGCLSFPLLLEILLLGVPQLCWQYCQGWLLLFTKKFLPRKKIVFTKRRKNKTDFVFSALLAHAQMFLLSLYLLSWWILAWNKCSSKSSWWGLRKRIFRT